MHRSYNGGFTYKRYNWTTEEMLHTYHSAFLAGCEPPETMYIPAPSSTHTIRTISAYSQRRLVRLVPTDQLFF